MVIMRMTSGRFEGYIEDVPFRSGVEAIPTGGSREQIRRSTALADANE